MASAPIIRTLGKNGLKIPALGYGLMLIGAPSLWRLGIQLECAWLTKLLSPTPSLYGDNEQLLKQWFQQTGKRDQIFLATKFGYVNGKEGKSIQFQYDTSYEYTKKACQASLDAMGTDYIDLYYVHQVDNVTPIEETMRALAELQAFRNYSEGKIKHIGLSMISSATLRRAVKIAPRRRRPARVLPLRARDRGPRRYKPARDMPRAGRRRRLRNPLGRGLLASDFGSKAEGATDPSDLRAKVMPRFLAENRAHNASVVARIREFAAERKGCSVSVKYLEENWAANWVKLSDEEEKELRHMAETSELAGEALPEQFMDHKFKDTKEL
ncbi:uncharacterized protein PG986_005101 [Apiospora aurea]|uniref:NADP-dependent oxidoreductase domain-containing protein n=1 Tax=Apiospora aurea TaxID=335848 RepID=A0ABR1QGL6_9PEZI